MLWHHSELRDYASNVEDAEIEALSPNAAGERCAYKRVKKIAELDAVQKN